MLRLRQPATAFLPHPRLQAVAGCLNRSIYVTGGIANGADVDNAKLDIYSTSTAAWSLGASLANASYGSGAVVSNILYSMVAERVGGPFAYDPGHDTWTQVGAMPP